MATLNKITGLVVGQYGTAIQLSIVDNDGIAVNLSSFTGVSVKLRSPDSIKLLTFTGSLVSGGTGGQITFTPTSSDTFDRDGTWVGQVTFTATNVLTPTVPFEAVVSKKV